MRPCHAKEYFYEGKEGDDERGKIIPEVHVVRGKKGRGGGKAKIGSLQGPIRASDTSRGNVVVGEKKALTRNVVAPRSLRGGKGKTVSPRSGGKNSYTTC